MAACNICPRECGVDRSTVCGFCGEGETIRVARAAPHYWEEPCISGTNGSGTVFFSGCNLRCVFCQNGAISHKGIGEKVNTCQLADIFLRLQTKRVHNINLVTPTHFAAQIKEALLLAKAKGLAVPVVWNSGGYESVHTLRSLKDVVDIYMPDFKYTSPELGYKYSHAEDYFTVAKAALDEMVLQKGGAIFDDRLMKKGVLVRHLVLPACTQDSKAVLRFLHRRYGKAIYISIMKQYTPPKHPVPDELGRALYEEEYDEVCEYAKKLGIEQGFFQEGDPVGESFVPDFDLSGVK